MIQDLCNWNDTFIGEKAKWIDECKASSSASEITLKDWNIATGLTDFVLLGGEKLDGDGCIRFAAWSSWAPYIAQAAVEQASDWATQVLGEPEVAKSDKTMDSVLADWRARDRATREKWDW